MKTFKVDNGTPSHPPHKVFDGFWSWYCIAITNLYMCDECFGIVSY